MVSAGFVFLIPALQAATRYTESFTDSDGGWRSQNASVMTVSWTNDIGNPDGVLRGFFGQLPPGPPGDVVSAFVADGAGSSSNLMGNYRASDVWLVGFDFNPVNIKPKSFDLYIYGGSSKGVYRNFFNQLDSANRWYSFRVAVTTPTAGSWRGNTNQFEEIMVNVTSLVFAISRNTTTTETYLLDNIFIDALPAGGEATAASNTSQIVWNNLRTNEVYRVEASPDLVVPQWTVIATITAQTSTVTTDYPATNDYRFFRMVMP